MVLAYKPFTVRNTYIDENLTNFRLLVRISLDADIGALARPDGYDLRFTTADGSTLLPYERVLFSILGGKAMGFFWVKAPLLSATGDNTFRLYYGEPGAADGSSPSATWGTGDYYGVWHLDGGVLDSSGHGRDGIDYSTTSADGVVSYCRQFDYTIPSRIDTGEWNASGDMTLLAWVYTTHSSVSTNVDDQTIVGKALWGGDGPGDFIFKIRYSGGANRVALFRYVSGGYSSVVDTRSLTTNAWYRVGVSYSSASGQATIYVNGEAGATGNVGGVMATNPHHVFLGVQESGLRLPWRGRLDEVMLRAEPSSAAWMKFDYRNQLSLGDEITWGDQVLLPPRFRRGLYLRSGSRGVAA